MKANLVIEERYVRTTDGSLALRYLTKVDNHTKIADTELLKELEESSGIPAAQFLACFYAFGEYLKEKLPLGYVVKVPSLGTFKLIANAAATDKETEAGENAVRKIRINFLADKELKKIV